MTFSTITFINCHVVPTLQIKHPKRRSDSLNSAFVSFNMIFLIQSIDSGIYNINFSKYRKMYGPLYRDHF
jgi:hypothetical protein